MQTLRADKLCYAEMQSSTSLALTAPYHVEEYNLLCDLINEERQAGEPVRHFTAVGAGKLRYMEMALRDCESYTAIEMNLNDHLTPQMQGVIARRNAVHLINKSFLEAAEGDLPKKEGGNKRLFLFMFNVFPYMPRPLGKLQQIVKRGDIGVISLWNDRSISAVETRNAYYDYLRNFCGGVFNAEADQHSDDIIRDTARAAKMLGAETRRKTGYITDSLILRF